MLIHIYRCTLEIDCVMIVKDGSRLRGQYSQEEGEKERKEGLGALSHRNSVVVDGRTTPPTFAMQSQCTTEIEERGVNTLWAYYYYD